MACGTETDGYDISTSWLEAEGAVKGRNTIYFTKGNADLGRLDMSMPAVVGSCSGVGWPAES